MASEPVAKDLEFGDVELVRVTTVERANECEPMWVEYGEWATAALWSSCGVDANPDHDGFRVELPGILGPLGRLYFAEIAGRLVGTGVLKPNDANTAEIKRMYVDPTARGRGISRAMLAQLLADATELGFTRVRLDTLCFMTEAQSLYRSVGFVETALYPASETARFGLGDSTVYMELAIGDRSAPESESR